MEITKNQVKPKGKNTVQQTVTAEDSYKKVTETVVRDGKNAKVTDYKVEKK